MLPIPAYPLVPKGTLRELPFYAMDMSANGGVFVGGTLDLGGEPVKWSPGQGLKRLMPKGFIGYADKVSADGSTVLFWSKDPRRPNWLYVKRGQSKARQVSKYVYDFARADRVHLTATGETVLTVTYETSVESHRQYTKVDRIVHLQSDNPMGISGVGMTPDGQKFFGSTSTGSLLERNRRDRAAIWDRNGHLTHLAPDSANSSVVSESNSDGSFMAGYVGDDLVVWKHTSLFKRFAKGDPLGSGTDLSRLGLGGRLYGSGYPDGNEYWADVLLPSGKKQWLSRYLEDRGIPSQGRKYLMVLKVSRDGKVLLVLGLNDKKKPTTWRVTLP